MSTLQSIKQMKKEAHKVACKLDTGSLEQLLGEVDEAMDTCQGKMQPLDHGLQLTKLEKYEDTLGFIRDKIELAIDAIQAADEALAEIHEREI